MRISVRRVSSQATKSTVPSVSTARYVISERFPIGVATMNKVLGMRKLRTFLTVNQGLQVLAAKNSLKNISLFFDGGDKSIHDFRIELCSRTLAQFGDRFRHG